MYGTYFSDSKYEILEIKNGNCYLRDKQSNKYYFKKDLKPSERNGIEKISECKWCIKDTIYTILIFLSILCLCDLIFRYNLFQKNIVYDMEFLIGSIVYIVINLVLHELAHSFVLKSWNRNIGKYKFKFKFIFPIISVDTSDAYMLPVVRKIFVFSAGIVINIFLCWFTAIIIPQWIGFTQMMLPIVIFNIMPLGYVRTDGYNIINALVKNTPSAKKIRENYDKICELGFLLLTIVVIIGILKALY